jgi:hypothetical protein
MDDVDAAVHALVSAQHAARARSTSAIVRRRQRRIVQRLESAAAAVGTRLSPPDAHASEACDCVQEPSARNVRSSTETPGDGNPKSNGTPPSSKRTLSSTSRNALSFAASARTNAMWRIEDPPRSTCVRTAEAIDSAEASNGTPAAPVPSAGTATDRALSRAVVRSVACIARPTHEEHFDLAHSTIAVFAAQREGILEQFGARAGPEGLVMT